MRHAQTMLLKFLHHVKHFKFSGFFLVLKYISELLTLPLRDTDVANPVDVVMKISL